MRYNKNKTLEELENDIWLDTDFPTGLVRKCFELRKKKLNDFSAEDLRLMITQNFSLEYLIPLAIEVLSNDILAEGNLYEGDLLESVLNSSRDFWQKNENLYKNISDLLERNADKMDKNKNLDELIKNELITAKKNFLAVS
jgi:hypothetical protein